MAPGPVTGVVITVSAAELLARLQERHGPVMFHQSGGCCDGSAPMCYPLGDFIVGDRDVLLGVLDVGSEGVPVWISGPQYQAHYQGEKRTQLVIDAVSGRGAGFSLEAPEGMRFLSRGRALRDDEHAVLRAMPVITGAGFERGDRPPVRGEVVDPGAGAAPVCGATGPLG